MCKCNLRVVKAKAVSRTFPLLTGENSGGGHVLIQYEMMVNWELNQDANLFLFIY